MKAKDVARSINEAVVEADIQGAWDAIADRMRSGESDNALQPAVHAMLETTNDLVAPLATEYLRFLMNRMGQQVKEKNMAKAASLRALLLSTDQAWRSFHSRLDPLAARAVNSDAFRSTVMAETPRLGDLAWPGPASRGNPFQPPSRPAPFRG